MKKILFSPIILGLFTAVLISVFVARPVMAEFEFDKITKNNCHVYKNAVKDQPIDIQSIDSDTGEVLIIQKVNGKDSRTRLSFKSSDKFSSCSEEAKVLLSRIKEIDDKQTSDTCSDFRDIIAGKRPIDIIDGVKANIEGAKQYVAKYCR